MEIERVKKLVIEALSRFPYVPITCANKYIGTETGFVQSFWYENYKMPSKHI